MVQPWLSGMKDFLKSGVNEIIPSSSHGGKNHKREA